MPQELAVHGGPYLGHPLASLIFGSPSSERDTQKSAAKGKKIDSAEIWFDPIVGALTKAEHESTRTSQSGRLRRGPRPPRPKKGSQHLNWTEPIVHRVPNAWTPRECGWRHGDRATRRAGVTRMASKERSLGVAGIHRRSDDCAGPPGRSRPREGSQHPSGGGGGGPPRQLGGAIQLRGRRP